MQSAKRGKTSDSNFSLSEIDHLWLDNRLKSDKTQARNYIFICRRFRKIIIIAFKGAIQDFLQSPHSAANCLQHARSSGPSAVVCKSRATHER